MVKGLPVATIPRQTVIWAKCFAEICEMHSSPLPTEASDKLCTNLSSPFIQIQILFPNKYKYTSKTNTKLYSSILPTADQTNCAQIFHCSSRSDKYSYKEKENTNTQICLSHFYIHLIIWKSVISQGNVFNFKGFNIFRILIFCAFFAPGFNHLPRLLFGMHSVKCNVIITIFIIVIIMIYAYHHHHHCHDHINSTSLEAELDKIVFRLQCSFTDIEGLDPSGNSQLSSWVIMIITITIHNYHHHRNHHYLYQQRPYLPYIQTKKRKYLFY